MSSLPVPARFAIAATMLLGLAGCDTFGLNLGGSSAPAAATSRAIDYRADDLTAVVFAVDAPTSLRLMPSGSLLTLDISGDKGGKHLKAGLVLADGDAVDGVLPPAGAGRTYFLLELSDKDKAAMRDAQKWLRSQADDARPVTVLNVIPKFCAGSGADASAATYSVIPALPGTLLLAVTTDSHASDLFASTGGNPPACS